VGNITIQKGEDMHLDHREKEIYNGLNPGQRHEIDDLLRLPAQTEKIKQYALVGLGTLLLLAILF
jgi:hypothetical protein